MSQSLKGKIAVVAGATRGAGRGIARMLGEQGATVICSGRSTTGNLSAIGRTETIDETAELVTQAGGVGVPIKTDHSQAEDVQALFERVRSEFGQLDILVNDIGGEDLSQWTPLWEADVVKGFEYLDTTVRTHILTSRYALPLMLEQAHGLIVEITDGDHAGYRGSFFHDIAKNQVIRLAFTMAAELEPKGVTAVAVTPGFLRSEAMLDGFGVSEANWRDAAEKVMGFSESETPCYVGRAVAALAADPNVHEKSGKVFASWTLAKEYGFKDIDGRQPDWAGFVARSVASILDKGVPDDPGDLYWVTAWYTQLKDDPRWTEMTERIASVLEI